MNLPIKFPSKYGELLHHYGLTYANGYRLYYEDRMKVDKCEYIYLDEECRFYKHPEKNIYEMSSHNNRYLFYHISISIDELQKILDDMKEKDSTWYIKYDEKGDGCHTKKVNTQLNISPERALMINNIKNKINLIPELNINILLYGEPGTGKSSFVDKFSTIIERDVHVLPISRPTILQKVVDKIASDRDLLILIPEIDKILDEKGDLLHNENELYEFLDGCNRPPGSVILITCNDIDKFKRNKALSRPGRIHFELCFTNVTMSDIKFMVNRYFPDISDYTQFKKYVDKVSHAEFNAALCQYFIMDEDMSKFDIKMKTTKTENHRIYY